MFDASCKQCGKRFGWAGTALDRPACPRCGHKPTQTELRRSAQEIDEFRALLAERPLNFTNKSVRTRQRHAAGLTLKRAAMACEIGIDVLEAIERGDASPLPWLEQNMREAYGLT
jgi:hypothetical protein